MARPDAVASTPRVDPYTHPHASSRGEVDDDETASRLPVGILAALDAVVLETVAQRLAKSDLVTLASFPAQPHARIHAVVAALQCVLLSLATAHGDAAAGLHMTPWALLRLAVLANVDAMWRKMWKRLTKLRRWQGWQHQQAGEGGKPLAMAQVRFVLRQVVVPAWACSPLGGEALQESTTARLLGEYARLSSISESVAAFVLLCAHYSVAAGSFTMGTLSTHARNAMTSPSKHVHELVPLNKSPSTPPKRTTATRAGVTENPMKANAQPVIEHPAGILRDISVRCGVKRGGRFFLFHVTMLLPPRSQLSPKPHGVCYVMSIDRVTKAAPVDEDGSEAFHELEMNSWITATAIAPSVVWGFQQARLYGISALSFLLQVAAQSRSFNPPYWRHIVVDEVRPSKNPIKPARTFAFSLKLAILIPRHAADRRSVLKLAALGDVKIHAMNTTLAQLRREMERLLLNDADSSFQFMLRGSLLQLVEERYRVAIELLPLGLVCVDGANTKPCHGKGKSRLARWAPCLWHLQHTVDTAIAPLSASQALAHQRGRTSTSLSTNDEPCIAELYTVNQVVAIADVEGIRLADDASLSLVDIFQNWTAFVHFQRMQDSVIVFKAPQSPRISSPKRATLIFENGEDEGDDNLRTEPTPEELELLQLPQKRFRPEKEYLRPLYAALDVLTPSTAIVRTPYLADLARSISQGAGQTVRLVVASESCVLHVRQPLSELVWTATSPIYKPYNSFLLEFLRDRSTPLEALLALRNAYVWQIVKLPITAPRTHTRSHKRSHESQYNSQDATFSTGVYDDNHSASPPRWLRDVYRFVTHPTWDFVPSSEEAHSSHTSPPMSPYRLLHVSVPHHKIERIVESTFWSRTVDWHAHWRDCDLEQLVFRAKYDTLCRSYPPSSSIDSVKFSKFLRECEIQPRHLSVGDAAFVFTTRRAPGSQYEMIYDGFRDAMRWIAGQIYAHETTKPDDQARRLCFEWLIQAPSMEGIWRGIVNSWRVREKLRFMDIAAREYCAATRIQANWKRVLTRRQHIEILTRLKRERRAAAKVQSVHKMRRERARYRDLRRCTIQTQLFILARRELRRLRADWAVRVEQMRVRIVRWMRQRLRVLRCWKGLNAQWLSRRARIQEKRSRLMWMGVYQLETRRYRVAMYRSPIHADKCSRDVLVDACAGFDVDVIDAQDSSGHTMHISQAAMSQLVHESRCTGRPAASQERKRWQLFELMQRLYFKTARAVASTEKPRPSLLRLYKSPLHTSLGRMLFQGTVHDQAQTLQRNPDWATVRLLRRGLAFTLVSYSSRTSTTKRWDFTTEFVFKVLVVASPPCIELRGDGVTMLRAVPQLLIMEAHHLVSESLEHSNRLTAVRCLLEYLESHGTKEPTRDMLPAVIAEREQERSNREVILQNATAERYRAIVVHVQANARRFLARKYLERLAHASYHRQFERSLDSLVYVLVRDTDVLRYPKKPRSLGCRDIALPIDEWKRVTKNAGSSETTRLGCYFNPLRGVFSRINDVQAACIVQRWYRRAMLFGVHDWDLRNLSRALRFHNGVHKPTNLDDIASLDQIVRYALQLHLLQHDFKAASTMYEAALALSPSCVIALVGLAILLVYSCQYPTKQTWPRALELLASARSIDCDLVATLQDIEDNCFCWAMFLHPKNSNTLGSYAVYLQCVRHELDKAEILYRRALDMDPANDFVIENYLRLQRERTPNGIYSDAGPGKVAAWRSQELHRVIGTTWRKMEDLGTRFPTAERFFQDTVTGRCVWTLPDYVGQVHDQE